MRRGDGLAAAAYSPCTVKTNVGETSVEIDLDTLYPFRESLRFKVTVDREAEFTLYLRIPGWADKASIQIDNISIKPEPGTFYELRRKWSGNTEFTLTLPMGAEMVSRPNGLFAVARGPLVYSHPIGQRRVRINEDMACHEYPHCDYEIYPTEPWNYGLSVDTEDPDSGIKFTVHPVGDLPFSPEGAPITAEVKAKKVYWPMKDGCMAAVPDTTKVSDAEETIRLIPYGCTDLRVTEMPVL